MVSVWWLVLLFAVANARKNFAPQLGSTLQAIQSSLQAEGEKDGAVYDKVGCWCQNQVVEKQQSVEKMQQEHEVLTHDIDEESARASRIDLELSSHEDELASSVSTLKQANALRKEETQKFGESEQSHTQSINQLEQALQALNRNHVSELALSLVQSAALRHLRMDAAKSQLAKLKIQLRGSASNSPAVVKGVIEQMKTMFKEDLSDLRQSEMDAKERHDGIAAAKSQEISSLKKQIIMKKQRTATSKVALGHKKQFLERSQKLLDINMQLLGALKTACTRNDESHQQRQEAQQAILVALSSAQAELSGVELLGVATAAHARSHEQVIGDGVALVCSAAREIFENKSWKARLQATCEKAQAGGAGALQDAADDAESLEDDIKAALEDAQNEQAQCERTLHDAEADASEKAQQASAEASFIGSEKAATASDIEDAESQVTGAKQAKKDMLEARSAQHRVLQDYALALTHNAELLRKASMTGSNPPGVAKIQEAEEQVGKLSAAAASFDKSADADTQQISAFLDSVQLAAGKVLIPLRLMHADSEEAAVAIDEEADSSADSLKPQCDVAKLHARVQLLSSHVKKLSTAATRLSMEALR